jgi:hypothetical protein
VKFKKQISGIADEIHERLFDLPGPKDAAMALLLAHVRLTLGQDLDRQAVAMMLTEYVDMFNTAYFGERPS